MQTILVVDDAPDVAEVVAIGVRLAWPDCRVSVAASGAEALRRFEEERVDAVVLDVEIPAPDGFEVCRRIREVSDVPILMLTVRDATLDKIRALDLGADDYLPKPFDPLELLARLRAILRRAGPAPPLPSTSERLTIGDLSIDTGSREVRLRGDVVQFTSTEYRLLEELARAHGSTVSHRELLERVWGPEYVTETGYVKAYVRRLRRKLGDGTDPPRLIQSDWGFGYRLARPPHYRSG